MKIWLIRDWHGQYFACTEDKLEQWIENEAEYDYKTIIYRSERSIEIDQEDVLPGGDSAYSADLIEVYDGLLH